MARENQGLQITLIVFVMLTIILGVTTYMFFRNYEEADTKAKNNLAERDKAAKLAAANEDSANELKRMLGIAKTEKVSDVTAGMFAEDMKKYGASYPEEVRFYRPLMAKLWKTIEERNAELQAEKAKNAKLEADFAAREAGKQPQLDDFKKASEQATKDLESERGKFKADRDRITQEQRRLKDDLESARKDSTATVASAEQKLKTAGDMISKLKTINQSLTSEKQQFVATKFETPSGEIRWVNQHSNTVWINLGRADALQRQISFGVYPADISDISAGKKASIEVTRILGDHLAEARLFDDKLTDPVMPGDKIYTPIWLPGEKRHFALAGFMDLHGEGKNELELVKDVITLNGGAVDCYLDEKGKMVGEMTVNTRFIVLGDAPTEKSQTSSTSGFTKIMKESQRLGVQTIQLSDLLHRMGWKEHTPVVHYGPGANPKDFAPKFENDVQPTSTGNHSDIYKKRQPPAKTPSSGNYYKFRM